QRAQLHRLHLGRARRAPRRGGEDDQPCDRAAARRRLHRRQPRLGLLHARATADAERTLARGAPLPRARAARAPESRPAHRRRPGDLRAPRRHLPPARPEEARAPALRGGPLARAARGRAAAAAPEVREPAPGAALAPMPRRRFSRLTRVALCLALGAAGCPGPGGFASLPAHHPRPPPPPPALPPAAPAPPPPPGRARLAVAGQSAP